MKSEAAAAIEPIVAMGWATFRASPLLPLRGSPSNLSKQVASTVLTTGRGAGGMSIVGSTLGRFFSLVVVAAALVILVGVS